MKLRRAIRPIVSSYGPILDLLEPRVMLSGADGGTAPAAARAVEPGPDLTIEFIRNPRRAVVGGETSRAAVAIRNVGSGAAATTGVAALYLSDDGVVDPGDRVLASVTRDRPLKPGRAARLRLTFTFPTDLPSGTFHVLARADDADAVPEVDEADNVRDGGAVKYAAPVVDIVPVAVNRVRLKSWRGAVFNGRLILLVRNNGNSPLAGEVAGTIRVQEVYPLGVAGNSYSLPFSRPISLRPRQAVKLKLTISPATMDAPEYVFTLTAAAPTDPTPDESVVSDPASVRYFSWGGRPL